MYTQSRRPNGHPGHPAADAPGHDRQLDGPAGLDRRWTDKKRYLWLIGLVVPTLAAIASYGDRVTGWGAVAVDRSDRGPGRDPGVRPDRRLDRSNPPDDVDRAARARPVLPLDHLPLPADPVPRLRRRDGLDRQTRLARLDELSVEKLGVAITIGCIGGIGINTAHELGHKRESTSAGSPRSPWRRAATATSTSSTTAGTTSAWPLPRTRQQPDGRDFLRLLAAYRLRPAQERLAGGEAALRPQGPAPVPDRQRRTQRLGDVGGPVRRADRGLLGSGSRPTS